MTLAAALLIAKFYAVHIDRPANAARFEELVRRQSVARRDVYAAHHVDPPHLFEFSTADGTYVTLRPRASLADFEKPSSVPADVRAILKEKVNVFDDEIHAQLREHHNEIWQYDEDSSWNAGATGSRMRVVTEQVRPAKFDAYANVVAKLREALEKTKSPATLLVFQSTYGDGALHYVWIGDTLPEPEAVLKTAFGAEEAKALMRTWREAVASRSATDAKPRADLAGTPLSF